MCHAHGRRDPGLLCGFSSVHLGGQPRELAGRPGKCARQHAERAYVQTHVCKHAHTHIYTHEWTCAKKTDTNTSGHTSTRGHTSRHTNKQTQRPKLGHTQSTKACTQTNMHTYKISLTHVHIHTYGHVHNRTYPHIQAHAANKRTHRPCAHTRNIHSRTCVHAYTHVLSVHPRSMTVWPARSRSRRCAARKVAGTRWERLGA